jgi:hypothetical protein
MEAENPPRCVSCSESMVFSGRISLPPEIIYRCEQCASEIWVANRPSASGHSQQPQAQQQQQPQPKSEAAHSADENDDARRLQTGLRGAGET